MARLVRALRIDDDAPEAIVAPNAVQRGHEARIEGELEPALLQEAFEFQEHLRLVLVREQDRLDVRAALPEPFARTLAHAALVDAETADGLRHFECSSLLFIERHPLPQMLSHDALDMTVVTQDDDGT